MKDRITVVERIYHQQEGVSPTESEIAYTRNLETSDQPYARLRIKAGSQWQLLIPKGCWLEKPGMVLVINHEGERFDVNPSQEELAEIAERVLEIRDASGSCAWEIPPNEPFKGTPTDHGSLLIRCRKGEARYSVTVFPS